jgi:DNA-binding NarL/FixJ family response regulator
VVQGNRLWGGERRAIGGIERRTPSGLSVERFEIDADEYAVFAWTSHEPPPELTQAERAVLARVVEGASNAEIARGRCSSARTVANQVASLLRKLGADSRFDLIRRYGDHAAPRSP